MRKGTGLWLVLPAMWGVVGGRMRCDGVALLEWELSTNTTNTTKIKEWERLGKFLAGKKDSLNKVCKKPATGQNHHICWSLDSTLLEHNDNKSDSIVAHLRIRGCAQALGIFSNASGYRTVSPWAWTYPLTADINTHCFDHSYENSYRLRYFGGLHENGQHQVAWLDCFRDPFFVSSPPKNFLFAFSYHWLLLFINLASGLSLLALATTVVSFVLGRLGQQHLAESELPMFVVSLAEALAVCKFPDSLILDFATSEDLPSLVWDEYNTIYNEFIRCPITALTAFDFWNWMQELETRPVSLSPKQGGPTLFNIAPPHPLRPSRQRRTRRPGRVAVGGGYAL